MNSTVQITLAIESAIGGGSLSLLRGDAEVANWFGSSNVSKAEDLLANIDAMLAANDISKREIELVAVSAGPGSFTGIRIGIATALGLKTGLGIEMSSVSALEAMAFTQRNREFITAAVPTGRNAVGVQSFRRAAAIISPLDKPRTLAEDEFRILVEQAEGLNFVVHTALYNNLSGLSCVTDFGHNVASAIGLLCREKGVGVTEPIFISKSF